MKKGIIIETKIKQAIAKGEGRAGIHIKLALQAVKSIVYTLHFSKKL